MGNLSEVECDLHGLGIASCEKAWKWSTDAWCAVRDIKSGQCAMDFYYIAVGICIVTDGKSRRILRGGDVCCEIADKRGSATVMMGGNARLYGIRLLAPVRDESWCGMDAESAMRGWEMLENMAIRRPVTVEGRLEAAWEEVLRRGGKAKAGGSVIDVSMAVGSLVAHVLHGIGEVQQSAIGTKSAERILSFLENCNVRCMPSVGILARRLGYSTGHLMTCARSAFGVTLKQCMDMIRCEHAIRLIKMRKTVGAVAKACGFESWVTFRMTFARQFGKSVNDMRRAYGITMAKHKRNAKCGRKMSQPSKLLDGKS